MCCSKPKPLIPEHIYICRIKETTDKTRLLIDLVSINAECDRSRYFVDT